MPNRLNFLELKKSDQLRTIGKLTINNLKDDPIALERMIRHNREAEINYFMNLVKHKIEKNQDNYLRYTSVDLEAFENDWFTTKDEFKHRLLRTSFKSPKAPEVDGTVKGHQSYDFRNHAPVTLGELVQPKEKEIHQVHNTIAEIGRTDLTPKPIIKKGQRQSMRGLNALKSNPSDRTHYKNVRPYDGQEEISKMETQFDIFLKSDRYPKLVMKPPDGTRVPNSHLSDYYLVRRIPRYFAPPADSSGKIINNDSAIKEIPGKEDSAKEPSKDFTLSGVSEGEEEMEGEEEESYDPETGLKRKKKRIKKKYPQNNKNPYSKEHSYNRLNHSKSHLIGTPLERSKRELTRNDSSSQGRLSPDKDSSTTRLLNKAFAQKKQPNVAIFDLVQQLLAGEDLGDARPR